jgi:hypothetical protein
MLSDAEALTNLVLAYVSARERSAAAEAPGAHEAGSVRGGV